MKDCVACHHSIDASAKICPYCGADPDTGEKVDIRPLVEEHFPPRGEVPATASVMAFLRQRQGVVVTVTVVACFLVLTAAHQLVTRRSAAQVSDVPAIPLTEVADLSRQSDTGAEVPLPDLDFTYDGNSRTMQTFLMEPGAVAPLQPVPVPPSPLPVGVQPNGTPRMPQAPPQGAPQAQVLPGFPARPLAGGPGAVQRPGMQQGQQPVGQPRPAPSTSTAANSQVLRQQRPASTTKRFDPWENKETPDDFSIDEAETTTDPPRRR